jgi:hypothetical protein
MLILAMVACTTSLGRGAARPGLGMVVYTRATAPGENDISVCNTINSNLMLSS